MNDLVVSGRAKAVQYVRMSTEHQRYSIENQKTVIAEYAATHGCDIIDTYSDEGRSGLTLKERYELNRLLRDVTDPDRRFSLILVLDVSRWGRFQDPDQHAAYEFICRDLGVQVVYVSELFDNDGSFASSLLKHMKRIMAAEYSRELSAKVSYGQIRGAQRGHKQGGTLTYGLKRILVGPDGSPKHELLPGQWKALREDKVVIVPGTPDERRVVKNIFNMYLAGETMSNIARTLNFSGVASTADTPWTGQKINTVLSNELYTGVYAYNRTTAKLKRPSTRNPQSQWVRVPVCCGIIDKKTFTQAQQMLTDRKRGASGMYASDKMIAGLKRLLDEKKELSIRLIRGVPYLPDIKAYYARFGGIQDIYNLVGYKRPQTVTVKCRRQPRGKAYSREELLAQLRRALAGHKSLSRGILEGCSYTASPHTYTRAFGSLPDAYRAAGYDAHFYCPGSHNCFDKEGALNRLKSLYETHGYISTALLFSETSSPSPDWYRRHFGSFSNACVAAGLHYDFGATIALSKFRRRRDYVDMPEGGQAPTSCGQDYMPDEELLLQVRRIFEENGYISRRLLESDPATPPMHRILKRYASIVHLYQAAGLPKDMNMVRFTKRRRERAEKIAEEEGRRDAGGTGSPAFDPFARSH